MKYERHRSLDFTTAQIKRSYDEQSSYQCFWSAAFILSHFENMQNVQLPLSTCLRHGTPPFIMFSI